MPAYRSDAEAEIRTAVVDRLRTIRPDARIIHEINVESFGNRIDVLAVSRAEIIAVEIKSERDKLDRLKDQAKAMEGCAHHVVAAVHEKFGLKPVRDALGWHNTAWFYPAETKYWTDPQQPVSKPLPANAIKMLWREELLVMCGRYSVSVPKRPNMGCMISALRWQLSGRDLTLGICAALRSRECIEADPAIEWKAAA